jgi:hypothetical protein
MHPSHGCFWPSYAYKQSEARGVALAVEVDKGTDQRSRRTHLPKADMLLMCFEIKFLEKFVYKYLSTVETPIRKLTASNLDWARATVQI